MSKMVLKLQASFLVLLSLAGCFAQQNAYQPQTLPAASCPSSVEQETIHQEIEEQVRDLLGVVPCLCGSPHEHWTRLAHLNMSDPSQQCPSNWTLIPAPVRGCGRSRSDAGCDAVTFPSNGRSYSHVCGRVIAIQSGVPDAFSPSFSSIPDLEGVYVDGVSLTHGPAGFRQHIWSFATAAFEGYASHALHAYCPCTNTSLNWPFQVPSFVGNNYFCDTANHGNQLIFRFHPDDPLWDGKGCGPSSACCEFNDPPWFCTTLPQPTTDDIELRICGNSPNTDEDAVLTLVEINVM